MEKLENVKATDTSKYNLRCNRNISEKMTKKDFIYDIPAPFQAMRKEKYLPTTLKRSRGNLECLITSTTITGSQVIKRVARREGEEERKIDLKLKKNNVGLVRLIGPRKLIPAAITTTCNSKSLSNVRLSEKERIVNKEPGEREIRRQIVLPIQLRRNIGSELKPPRYSVISTSEEHELNNSIDNQLPERKILGYQCNYCREREATLLSLSTHVKYHCEKYCTTCFWILEPEESMTQHAQKAHPINAPGHVLIPDHM